MRLLPSRDTNEESVPGAGVKKAAGKSIGISVWGVGVRQEAGIARFLLTRLINDSIVPYARGYPLVATRRAPASITDRAGSALCRSLHIPNTH